MDDMNHFIDKLVVKNNKVKLTKIIIISLVCYKMQSFLQKSSTNNFHFIKIRSLISGLIFY